MSKFKRYTKKDGTIAYKFQIYAGIDKMTGKPKRTRRRGFKTKREARLAYAALQLEFQKEQHEISEAKTFKEVYDLWINQHQHTVRDVTNERIRAHFDSHILPLFGEYNITKIPTSYCQKQLNHWASYYGSFRTLKSYTQKVFDFAITMNIMKYNPMRNCITPKKKKDMTKKQAKKFYDVDELKLFFHTIENDVTFKDFAIFRTLAFTGLRRGELMALTWQDIDFNQKMLTVDKSLTTVKNSPLITPPKNENSERIISLDEQTLAILKQWKTQQAIELLQIGINANKPSQVVFTHPSKGNLNAYLSRDYINHSLNVIFKKHDLPRITPHDFRRTHATLLFESGASLKEVQDRLGHGNSQITLDLYTFVTKKAREDTADRFAEYANF